MLRKILNVVITALAIVGIFLFIGAVGTVDMYTEMGEYYPVVSTMYIFAFSILLMLPALIRGIYNVKK